MDSINEYFHPITSRFLDRNWPHGFDIYYRVFHGDQEQYLKFANYHPENHEKILGLMRSEDGQLQEFFIHETDLVRYYREFLVANCKQEIEAVANPDLADLGRVYQLAFRILTEYFENMASTQILRALDEVVDILVTCLTRGSFTFPGVFSITEKLNHNYIHCANVGLYCLTLGVTFKITGSDLRDLGLGGMLCDIGKKHVDFDILTKDRELTRDEFKVVRKHPMAGRKVLADLKRYSVNVLSMAGEHHEKWDGTGYPQGLEGEKISFHARICCIMDVFSALTSDRSYRDRFPPAKALSIMKNEMQGTFDDRIVTLLLSTLGSPNPSASQNPQDRTVSTS